MLWSLERLPLRVDGTREHSSLLTVKDWIQPSGYTSQFMMTSWALRSLFNNLSESPVEFKIVILIATNHHMHSYPDLLRIQISVGLSLCKLTRPVFLHLKELDAWPIISVCIVETTPITSVSALFVHLISWWVRWQSVPSMLRHYPPSYHWFLQMLSFRLQPSLIQGQQVTSSRATSAGNFNSRRLSLQPRTPPNQWQEKPWILGMWNTE